MLPLEYYEAISDVLLPHLRDRPVSFKRYPDGLDGEFFWEKDAPGFTPDWVPRFAVPRRGKGEEPIHYIVINDLRTLRWVVQAGGIELHPFLHQVPRIDLATHIAFDLDPGEGADIFDCARVALLLRDALQSESFAKVSGSKGIQVYVPFEAPHAATEPFARELANELARAHPELITSQMTKSLRRNKVFIDWSQNASFKTMVSVYSVRSTGLVSMPVRWEELERPRKLTWDASEAIARIREVGDLWPQPVERRALARRGEPGGLKPAAPLPKPKSQSGRRLFVQQNDELWLEMGGKFWTLAEHEIDIDPRYYKGELPVEDTGAYEVIEGSLKRGCLRLWFSGSKMKGEWLLEKKSNRWTISKQPPTS
ncbi:MAG TPA: ATP-dependent DNA ligase [Thermoanaerobaculia bacterium]|nr:ATP-dependent DNA ligase [Thermoanaerobaculia bacterium]